MRRILGFFAAALLFPSLVLAETIELVTYYPTSSNNSLGRFHADRGTVGNPYSLNNPADPLPSGMLLVAGPLGIGTNFSAVALPAAALHITTGQGVRVEQGLPTGGLFDGTGYELYRDGVERMHLYYNTTLNWVELNTGATPNASLAFVNNGGQTRMFLDGATGNVGIGTVAPVFPLEVVRNQNATVVAGGFSNTSAGNAGVTDLRVGQDVETGNGQYGALNYYGSGTPANFQGYGNPNQVSLVAALRAVNGLSIATNANAPIKFLTNSSGVNNERMRITPDGRVLIGTAVVPPTAPTTMLAIRRDADEMVFSRVENTNNSANAAARLFVVSQQAATPISIGIDAFSQNFNPALLGDFVPGSTAISTFATFGTMDASRGNLLIASRGPNQRIGFHTGNTLINAASERMRITNAGLVGIGTPAPVFNLDVAAPAGQDGNIRIRGGGNVARLRLENTGPGGRRWSISSISNAFPPAGGFAIADETTSIQRLQIAVSGRTTLIGGLTVAGGSKNFEIPHPLKPGFRLIHSTLEGPEIAVFYRGEARLAAGKAVIKLPDYFEKLTRPEGRTAQLTAKGEEPFLLSYSSIENGKLTVHGSKLDGEFSWEVMAVRADLELLQVEEKQP